MHQVAGYSTNDMQQKKHHNINHIETIIISIIQVYKAVFSLFKPNKFSILSLSTLTHHINKNTVQLY